MADNEYHDAQVQEFCQLCTTSPDQAVQYLTAHNWDMMAACNSFFQDQDEESSNKDDQQNTAEQEAAYSGPRTLDGRPAPASSSSTPKPRAAAPQGKRKGIATLGSLGGGGGRGDDDDDDHDADDDEDKDGRGNLFAGGEKSALAVKDPSQDSGPRKIISDILARAKANSAKPEAAEGEDPSGSSRQGPTSFRGTGVTLGGDGVESRSIVDPSGQPEAAGGPPQERILHIWENGFSIDDGELRRFDDPSNSADLEMIRSGRAPLHLMNLRHNQPVDVKLHQHDTEYKQPPKQYKPFGGSGQRLGAVVPGESSSQLASATASGAATPTAQGQAPTIDTSQPTLMIRIQLPDGTRLPARFNATHTVADVYSFVQNASSDTRSRPWVLSTTFPNKDHTDQSLVLGEMPEFKKGGTAVVKWT